MSSSQAAASSALGSWPSTTQPTGRCSGYCNQGRNCTCRSGTAATIRAKDLSLLLFAHNMRKSNSGLTCQLSALSQTHLIRFSCRDQQRYGAEAAARAVRMGMFRASPSPLQRGDIAEVYERTRREHGLKEVAKVWGCGIRALLAENLHILNGGAA